MSLESSTIGHGRRPKATSLFRRLICGCAVLVAAPLLSSSDSRPSVFAHLAAPALHAQETGLPVGAKAPGALVETLDGKPFDLGQYIGKTPMLIEFWATWCPNCKELEPAMAAAARKYAGKVRFIGVAVSVNQSPERVKLYAEKHGLPLEIYFDRKGAAADAYDAAATSYVVVIDRNGTVVYTGLGGTQNLDAALQKAIAG